MPNGGNDCCGTCWFNRKNEGKAGYNHADSSRPYHCEIPDLPITDPFYTYCANHPHRDPSELSVPLGPVFSGDSDGRREVRRPWSDNEDVRKTLLELLTGPGDLDRDEYPIGLRLGEVVLWQLAEFEERRAIPELRRLADLDEGEPDCYGSTLRPLIEQAKVALAKLRSEPSHDADHSSHS